MTSPQAQYQWSAHPAAERRGHAAAGTAIVLAVAASVYATAASAAWAVGSLVLLVGALNRFYFRSRFTIDGEGITARYPLRTQRLRWRDARRFVTDRHGGYLSPRPARSWRDAWSGLHVLFGSDRDAVVAQIRRRLAGPREAGA